MRKRNCDNLFDNIFWYTLYLLPVIVFIGNYFSIYHDTGSTPDTMTVILSLFGGFDGELSSNLIMDSFVDVFYYFYDPSARSVGSYIEFFTLLCMAHFILVYIFHLFVDFLLFIPRLAHKWMNSFTQGD